MICLQAFALFLLLPALFAAQSQAVQSQQYEGKPIRAIEYAPTAQPLTPSDLQALQTLMLGEPLRREDVSAAIDKLFSSGRYSDIQAEIEPRGDGVVVRFVTKPQSFIGHISVTGKVSSPPKVGQIEDATQLNLGTPLDLKAVDDSDHAIEDLFHRNGLYEATVTHSFIPVPEGNQMMIVFQVQSNHRARFQMPVITGDPKLPVKDIVKATGWHRFLIGGWKTITEARVRNGLEGVQKKYQKKDRLMAKVVLKSLDYNASTRTATPTLDINAGPKVTVRAVEAKISKGTLKKYVPIYDEQSVDRDLIVEGARNLRDYLQSQGYYEADIDFREIPDEANDRLTIEYVVAKGKRYKLSHIELKGISYFQKDDVEDDLILRTASFPAFRYGRYSEAYRQRDEQNITNLYKANGFRDVKVTSTVQTNYKGKPDEIAVTYDVDEGPQWMVDTLNVNGIENQAAETILSSRLTSVQGQPFSEFNVAADRKTILDFYYSRGYPTATFRFRYNETGVPNHVNLTYEITEGPQRFVRDILISGLQETRRSFVEKNLKIKKNDPLSPLAMTDSQHALYNLGVFAKVQAVVQNQDGATSDKYVQFDMDEASRYTMRLGVGADISRFGPTTTDLSQPDNFTGFSPRFSAEISRINFLGIGHTVSLQGRVSNLEQRALLNYYAPRFRNVEGRNITFTLLYDDSRDVRTFSSQREEASIQVSQKVSKAVSALFRFSYRRVSTSNVVIPTLLVPQLLQPVRIGILSANLIQDHRNNPANPSHGMYNTIDVGVASNAFGSQRSFLRTLGRNATYYPIGKDKVLARQTTFGVIQPFSIPAGLSTIDAIPLPERFFGGGGQSMRGFPENQAGPRDIGTPSTPGGPSSQPTGFPLGGNAVFFNTVEYRFPLLGENIGGVFFHDMGNIFDKFGDISFRASQKNLQDFNYMVHAVGFGIRYKTPVGPVRVDLAYSINPPSFLGFKGTYQQLLMCNPNPPPGTTNPSYCTPVQQSISHFQFFFSIGQTF